MSGQRRYSLEITGEQSERTEDKGKNYVYNEPLLDHLVDEFQFQKK